MQSTAEFPGATLVILQDARAMQATDGANMLRHAATSLVRMIVHLLHVERVTIGHTTAG